jgi:large subunit ribosomal protein L23
MNLIVNNSRLMQILVMPVISEKSTYIVEKNNQVIFKVLKDANKLEIKAALELIFGVTVKKISILNQKGKNKKFGRFVGKRNNVKKAYISLGKGQQLNFVEGIL